MSMSCSLIYWTIYQILLKHSLKKVNKFLLVHRSRSVENLSFLESGNCQSMFHALNRNRRIHICHVGYFHASDFLYCTWYKVSNCILQCCFCLGDNFSYSLHLLCIGILNRNAIAIQWSCNHCSIGVRITFYSINCFQ